MNFVEVIYGTYPVGEGIFNMYLIRTSFFPIMSAFSELAARYESDRAARSLGFLMEYVALVFRLSLVVA